MSQSNEQPNKAILSKRIVAYVISIWAECQRDYPSSWHGSLETVAGQCFNFTTLAELECLLCELGGWMDPPGRDEGDAVCDQ